MHFQNRVSPRRRALDIAGVFASPFLVALAFHASTSQASAPTEVPAAYQAGQIHVEPSKPIRLSEVLALARQYNRELSASARELDAAGAGAQQSAALPNPELSAEWEEIGKSTRTTSLQFSQLIELGGKRGARMRAAERGRDAASAEYDAKRIDVLTRATQSFTDLLAAQRRMALSERAVAQARQAADAVARRVAAGKVSPVEETKARLEAGAARIEAEQAARELAAARRRLSAFWGNATPRFTEAAGDLESLVTVPPLEQLAQRVQTSPEFTRAAAEVGRREALLDGERAKRIPDVTFGAGVKRAQESRENFPLVTLSIPLPLFDRNAGNVQEALQRVDKARDERAFGETRLQSELGQSYERLRAVEMEVNTLREELLPAANSAYEAAGKGYELGKFGYLDALDAQRTLFQTNQQYVKALAEYHRNVAELERLVGGPLTADRANLFNR